MEVKELTQESMIKNNNPIIQRESGSYYIKDPKTGKQQTVKSPNEHGNTLGNQPAERYKLVDKKQENL
ncbi:hypothetical protein BSPWISOXPB_3479 [uncultured Gammaproteobacteria bacterium]|nr:hypothetical protein BSPWISOXPB_3479 [uncultured Gammaproteobacteria bacterium]